MTNTHNKSQQHSQGKKLRIVSGEWILLDPEDVEKVLQYRWYFDPRKGKRSGRIYACPKNRKGKVTTLLLTRFLMNPKNDEKVLRRNKENPFDFRKSSLFISTDRQFQLMRPKMSGKATSRFKGVHKMKCGKWRANISNLGATFHLGVFDDEIDAARAYNVAASSLFGEECFLNDVASSAKDHKVAA